MKKIRITRARCLALLLQTGYLPSEVPPAITTRILADYAEAKYQILLKKLPAFVSADTKSETFTAPRTKSGRRNLAIVHPQAQIGLSILIAENRSNITKLLLRSTGSCYDPMPDLGRFRAFSGLDFTKFRNQRLSIASEHKFVVRADISRFFYTVYSHSIPWAILGKEKAKILWKKKKLKGHWSDRIDSSIQAAQSRETFGIPVGPDTSRILAELIMSRIEQDTDYSELLEKYPYVRLIDDIFIGCPSEDEARKCLSALRNSLWKFNLQINEEKTKIIKAKDVYPEKWKLEFDNLSIRSTSDAAQKSDVLRMLGLTLVYCAETNDASPASWACIRITNVKKLRSNTLPIILETLLRLSREFPSCLNIVAAFLINKKDLILNCGQFDAVNKWISYIVRFHYNESSDLELSWALLIAGIYGISIDESYFSNFDKFPNAVVFTILGLLRERGLLKFSLSKWKFRSIFLSKGIDSEYWLPIYEMARRGWTKDKKIIHMTTAHLLFSDLLNNKVDFIEDSFFDVAEINLQRRTFRPRRPGSSFSLPPATPSGSARPSSTTTPHQKGAPPVDAEVAQSGDESDALASDDDATLVDVSPS